MGAPQPTPRRRERNPERGEEGERGEAEGEEKGGQAKDDRTDSKGTPKNQREKTTTTTKPKQQQQQECEHIGEGNDNVGWGG